MLVVRQDAHRLEHEAGNVERSTPKNSSNPRGPGFWSAIGFMVDGVRVDHLVESVEVAGVDELRHALQRCDVISLVI